MLSQKLVVKCLSIDTPLLALKYDDKLFKQTKLYTVEPQWLEHLWDHGNSFETWVVRATVG